MALEDRCSLLQLPTAVNQEELVHPLNKLSRCWTRDQEELVLAVHTLSQLSPRWPWNQLSPRWPREQRHVPEAPVLSKCCHN